MISIVLNNRNGILDNLHPKMAGHGFKTVRANNPAVKLLITYADVRKSSPLVDHFQKRGIPVLMVQHGRDTMEEYIEPKWYKGIIPLKADKVCVWGTHDYARAVTIAGKHRVFLTGNPAFDTCIDRDKKHDKYSVITSYKLPNKKIILYGVPFYAGTKERRWLFHFTFEILDRIIETTKQYKDYMVVIKTIRGPWEKCTEKYKDMGIPIIATKKMVDPTHLKAVTALTNASEMVFAAGDMCLFGMIFKKPTFDMFNRKANLRGTLKPYLEKIHKNIERYIDAAIKEPVADHGNILRQEAGPIDGKSSDRVLKIARGMIK